MADSQGNVEPRYDVELISIGTNSRRVARTVASFADLRNEEAKELLRTAPVLILRNASYATAEGARDALERLGATVEMRAYDVEAPRPEPGSVPPMEPPSKLRAAIFVIIAVIIFIALIFLAAIGSSFSQCTGTNLL